MIEKIAPSGWQLGEIVLDSGVFVDLELRAASLCGLSHKILGIPRQDAYGIATTGSKLVIVVADGVGSTSHAHEASHLAVRVLAGRVSAQLETGSDLSRSDWYRCFSDAASAISRLSMARQPDGVTTPAESSMQFSAATTAVVAVFSSTPGGKKVVIASVGDSVGIVLHTSGNWDWLRFRSPEVTMETFLDNAVTALPYAPRTGDEIELTEWDLEPGDVTFIVSDGMAALLGTSAFRNLLAEKWKTPPTILELADILIRNRTVSNDDLTAVGVWTSQNSQAENGT